MPRTMQQILDQADTLADQFEAYEPDPADKRDPKALKAISQAVTKRARVETALVKAVGDARDAGYSWANIGALLGTSGEAARQRYGQLIHH